MTVTRWFQVIIYFRHSLLFRSGFPRRKIENAPSSVWMISVFAPFRQRRQTICTGGSEHVCLRDDCVSAYASIAWKLNLFYEEYFLYSQLSTENQKELRERSSERTCRRPENAPVLPKWKASAAVAANGWRRGGRFLSRAARLLKSELSSSLFEKVDVYNIKCWRL